MEEWVKAYTAGFIDGEGWIGIQNNNHRACQSKTGRNYWQVSIHVSQKDRAVLDWLKKQWGGGNVYLKRGTPRYPRTMHSCHRWCIYSHDAILLLRECLPYFKVKQKQAEIAARFPLWRKKGHPRSMPIKMYEERNKIAQELRKLKGLPL